MQRKKIKVRQQIAKDINLDGNVEEIIQYLESFLVEYGPTLYVKTEYCGYDERETNIYYLREETDLEFTNRCARADKEIENKAARLERKEKKEREKYLKLKRKYENAKEEVVIQSD